MLYALAIRPDDGSACAEVDLGLLPGFALEPAERQLVFWLQAAYEAAHAVVAAGKAVFGDQVLVDPLSREATVTPGLDHRPEGLAVATSAASVVLGSRTWAETCRRRFGHVLVRLRADGRNGRFWCSLSQPDVSRDGLAPESQFVGDPALGPPPAVQVQDQLDHSQIEQIRHAGPPGARNLPQSLACESGSPQNGRFSKRPSVDGFERPLSLINYPQVFSLRE
jgi:hypothetical protein